MLRRYFALFIALFFYACVISAYADKYEGGGGGGGGGGSVNSVTSPNSTITVTGSTGPNVHIDLPIQSLTPGSYTNINGTVDAEGRLTSISSGAAGGVTSVTNSDASLTVSPTTGAVGAQVSTNGITNAKLRQSAGLSVVGNSTNSTANVGDITATGAHQFFGTDASTGTSLSARSIVGSDQPSTTVDSHSNTTGPPSVINFNTDGTWNNDIQGKTTDGNLPLNSQCIPHYWAGVANVATNNGAGHILIAGDSTTWGDKLTNIYTQAYPHRVHQLLNQCGIPSSEYFAWPNDSVNTHDTRWTLGTGWSYLQTGLGCADSQSATGDLVFDPTYVSDTVTILWPTLNVNYGSVTVKLEDGTVLGTLNENGANALNASTFTYTRGYHQIHVTGSGGTGHADIIGMWTRDSSKPNQMFVSNGGVSGFTSANWIAAPNYNGAPDPRYPLYVMQHMPGLGFPLDLVTMDLTINDIVASLPATTWASHMNTLATAMKSQNTDFVFIIGNPINDSIYTWDAAFSWAYYAQAMGLARTIGNGTGVYSCYDRWTNFLLPQSLNWYADFGVHPNNQGHFDKAQGWLGAVGGFTRSFVGLNQNDSPQQVNGTAGDFLWQQTAQGNFKKVTIQFNAYTNTATSTITFPTAFINTPSVSYGGSLVTVSGLSTTGVTIPITASATSGNLVIEGF